MAVVYDNKPYDDRLKKAWGFGCFVNVDGIGILFDTGGDSDVLLSNMAKLNINVENVDVVVLSHTHGDHVGGLLGILNLNGHMKVYVPASFPRPFKDEIKSYGCEMIEARNAVRICDGVATTGELGVTIKEQSLLISTQQGLVVVTGCAHPGIVNAVRETERLTGRKVYLAVGGYHLSGASEGEITSIIQQFKTLGVEKVAPCHCSGDIARTMFEQSFSDNFIETGVGKTFEIK